MNWLAPIPADARAARLMQLYAGLILYGLGNGLLVLSTLGLDPWDVLHQGLSRSVGLDIGTWTCLVGAVVLIAWIPLRQRPGLGTASNVVVIGLVVDLMLSATAPPHALGWRYACLLGGIVLNAVATGAYVGAGCGPGPRDGLTTGFVAAGDRRSIRIVRTIVELSVLACGCLLGGTIGVGTVAYALLIGPLTHVTLPRLDWGARRGRWDAGAIAGSTELG